MSVLRKSFIVCAVVATLVMLSACSTTGEFIISTTIPESTTETRYDEEIRLFNDENFSVLLNSKHLANKLTLYLTFINESDQVRKFDDDTFKCIAFREDGTSSELKKTPPTDWETSYCLRYLKDAGLLPGEAITITIVFATQRSAGESNNTSVPEQLKVFKDIKVTFEFCDMLFELDFEYMEKDGPDEETG